MAVDCGLTPEVEPRWAKAVDRCSRSTVVIEYSQTVACEHDVPHHASATGFIVHVDENYGLVLTCAHVVRNAPFWGRAIFSNHEAVCLLNEEGVLLTNCLV